MTSEPLESVKSESPVDTVEEPGKRNNQANETLVNETIVNEDDELIIVGEDGTFDDDENLTIHDDTPSDSSPSGLINEYNSAVNYISNLIDQLRDKPGVPRAVESFAKSLSDSEDLDGRVTQVVSEGRTDGSNTILVGDADVESSATLHFSEDKPSRKPEEQEAKSSRQTQAYQPKKAQTHRRSMLHNLREAAHLATNASLDLNDCAAFAYRAYYYAFLGCASSLISIALAIMSPSVTVLGLALSMAAFSLSLGLGFKYLMSFRAFVSKSAQALNSES